MKKITFLIIFAIAGLFLASCDKIEEGEYIKDGSSIWYGRKIVVLDFTGHKCGNCPKGHKALSLLEEKYGEQGYLKLFLPESHNADNLRQLRNLIADKHQLRTIFDQLFAELKS